MTENHTDSRFLTYEEVRKKNELILKRKIKKYQEEERKENQRIALETERLFLIEKERQEKEAKIREERNKRFYDDYLANMAEYQEYKKNIEIANKISKEKAMGIPDFLL